MWHHAEASQGLLLGSERSSSEAITTSVMTNSTSLSTPTSTPTKTIPTSPTASKCISNRFPTDGFNGEACVMFYWQSTGFPNVSSCCAGPLRTCFDGHDFTRSACLVNYTGDTREVMEQMGDCIQDVAHKVNFSQSYGWGCDNYSNGMPVIGAAGRVVDLTCFSSSMGLLVVLGWALNWI